MCPGSERDFPWAMDEEDSKTLLENENGEQLHVFRLIILLYIYVLDTSDQEEKDNEETKAGMGKYESLG